MLIRTSEKQPWLFIRYPRTNESIDRRSLESKPDNARRPVRYMHTLVFFVSVFFLGGGTTSTVRVNEDHVHRERERERE